MIFVFFLTLLSMIISSCISVPANGKLSFFFKFSFDFHYTGSLLLLTGFLLLQ